MFRFPQHEGVEGLLDDVLWQTVDTRCDVCPRARLSVCETVVSAPHIPSKGPANDPAFRCAGGEVPILRNVVPPDDKKRAKVGVVYSFLRKIAHTVRLAANRTTARVSAAFDALFTRAKSITSPHICAGLSNSGCR